VVGTSFGDLPATTDPNLDYAARLEPAEQANYRVALYGSTTSSDAESLEGGGCVGQANAIVRGRHLRILAPMAAAIADLRERTSRDPRVTDAKVAWVHCMEVEGIAARSVETFYAEMPQRFRSMLAQITSPDSSGQYDRTALHALQAEEIGVATAAADCSEELDATNRVVSAEHEARFVEDHKRELERARVALRALEAQLFATDADSDNP
jgi:hypothetical protein